MSIAAANVSPNFALRRVIHANDLKRLQEPAVIREHHGFDSDGESYFVYTVAGWLDGQNIAGMMGGATIGGDVIVIHARDEATADAMAGLGLEDTINALHQEDERIADAMAAQNRLRTVGAVERLNLATKPNADKSDAFVEDVDKLRVLVGDDIVMTSGH
jgi:hypothetical protein